MADLITGLEVTGRIGGEQTYSAVAAGCQRTPCSCNDIMDGIVRVTASKGIAVNSDLLKHTAHLQNVFELPSGARVEYQVCTGEIATQGLVGCATSDESFIEGWVFHVPRYRALAVGKSHS